jgi:hypothetical protein
MTTDVLELPPVAHIVAELDDYQTEEFDIARTHCPCHPEPYFAGAPQDRLREAPPSRSASDEGGSALNTTPKSRSLVAALLEMTGFGNRKPAG